MPVRFRLRVAALAMAVALHLLVVTAGAQELQREEVWPGKIAPALQAAMTRGEVVEALVVLDDQADLTGVESLRLKTAKGRFVRQRLVEVARSSQADLLRWLEANGVEHRSFWIHNMVWVRASASELESLAQRPEVSLVATNQPAAVPRTQQSTRGACPAGGVEPGLTHLGGEMFWNEGVLGQGTVIGGLDTGYDWQHPAVRDAYRGWNGASAEHDYSWHDAIHSGGGVCGADSAEPCDDHGHGTHTLGILVGEAGGSRFGMAPGARWIGCRGMDQGNGTPATYSECLQWFVAPTDSNGENPDPTKAPDVINNSWHCNAAEGCTDPNVLLAVVQNVRAAGIVVVTSAGNAGSSCSTIAHPPAIYDESLTVGATDLDDQIASFSSRGPVTSDGSDRLKPDVTAPGVQICSAWPGNHYARLSGTSMAAPHVAGLTALLISARPCLRGEVDALEALVRGDALARTSNQSCGSTPGGEVPNNTYGWGVVRAQVPSPQVCDLLFADDFESAGTAAWSVSSP